MRHGRATSSIVIVMESKATTDERDKFRNRLIDSLAAAGVSAKPAEFVRAFNARADGAAVTVHAARKWLVGDAIPTHEKIVILAVWLGANAAWLRFGDVNIDDSKEKVIPEANVSTPSLALLNDILSLPPPAQKTIRGIVDAFLRNYGQDK